MQDTMAEKKNVKIFVCYEKRTPVFKSETIVPIQAGRDIAQLSFDDMAGDNTGDNISAKHDTWGDLTVLYWMWKNVKADNYGLFQSNRFLNLNSKGDGIAAFQEFTPEVCEQMGLNDEKVLEVCAQYDIVTSPVWSVNPIDLPHRVMSNYDLYAKSHFQKDLDVVIEIIKEHYPRIYPFALRSLYSKESFFHNLFVMKGKYFKGYCEWVFDVLGKAEERIDTTDYDSYQRRVYGFLAERLINCYVEYVKTVDAKIRYATFDMVLGIFNKNEFDPKALNQYISSNKSIAKSYVCNEVINVVYSVENETVDSCAASVSSVLDYVNGDQKIDFYVLHDITFNEDSINRILSLRRENINIIFLTVNRKDFSYYPMSKKSGPTDTYYRLALHKILPSTIKKVIYLDSNTIITDNLGKLWDIELGEAVLAGSPDGAGITNARRLGLPLSHTYINVGVCVMNIKEMRKYDLDNLYSEIFFKNADDITLADQDIINMAFANKIKRLHLRWNVQARCYKANELECIYDNQELSDAATKPGILHYSDRQRSWLESGDDPLKLIFDDFVQRFNDEFIVF